jgi:hypothetical protein
MDKRLILKMAVLIALVLVGISGALVANAELLSKACSIQVHYYFADNVSIPSVVLPLIRYPPPRRRPAGCDLYQQRAENIYQSIKCIGNAPVESLEVSDASRYMLTFYRKCKYFNVI